MEDYPAAHSMDTIWFAVDADGNVGYFHSSEGGAVPESNQRSEIECNEDLFVALAENYPERIVYLNVSGDKIFRNLTIERLDKAIGEWRSFYATRSEYSGNDDVYNLLLLLSSKDVIPLLEIQTFEDEDPYILSFTGEPSVIFISHCRISTLQKLIESKQILGGCEWDYSDYLLNAFGFFSYSVGLQFPMPYDRQGKPPHPLKLQDLPPSFRDKIYWIVFDNLKFSESRKIQPIEHMQCHTWGNDKNWLDTQGNDRETHPHDPD